MTNRLRTEATDHLLAAGRAGGARRVVAQSFGAFRFARQGGPALTEADPLDPDPPASLRALQEALRRKWDRDAIAAWGQARGWGQVAGEVLREMQAIVRETRTAGIAG